MRLLYVYSADWALQRRTTVTPMSAFAFSVFKGAFSNQFHWAHFFIFKKTVRRAVRPLPCSIQSSAYSNTRLRGSMGGKKLVFPTVTLSMRGPSVLCCAWVRPSLFVSAGWEKGESRGVVAHPAGGGKKEPQGAGCNGEKGSTINKTLSCVPS